MIARLMEISKSPALPKELWLEIFQYLNYESLNHTAPLVCREFYELILPQSSSLSALDKSTTTSFSSSSSSIVTRSQSAPSSSRAAKYALHPKLRSRFKLSNPNSIFDTLQLVRQQHRESFDCMKHDDAAVGMMAAQPGWGEFDSPDYDEPAVSPSVRILHVRVDEKQVRSVYHASDVTVRDVLIAEHEFVLEALENKRATFELFRKNLLKQYYKEINGVGSLRFWDTKLWTAREEDHIRKTKRAYDKHRRYLDAEERLYIAFDEWKVKRTKAAYELLVDYYAWVKETSYRL